jgi:hypothetical protein
MKREIGGASARPGFYWRPAEWEIVSVPAGGRVLPGGPAERYVRIPTAGMLALAPALGAALVMFVPLAGFAIVLQQLGRTVRRRVRRRAAPATREAA